jgi:hypothetical protein
MSDDWRLRISLHEGGHAHKLTEHLEASELEHDLETTFHDRLVVSRDGEELFCYAGSREQIEGAQDVVRALATEHGWHPELELRRWHESAEQWEDPDLPVAQDDAERAAEHGELVQREREEIEERGYPEFEVRVQFASHHEAVAFAKKLTQEGLPTVRRWKYLVIATTDEDAANALAARIRTEAGPGSTVIVEGSGQVAYDERPPNPFWFLGGLGG